MRSKEHSVRGEESRLKVELTNMGLHILRSDTPETRVTKPEYRRRPSLEAVARERLWQRAKVCFGVLNFHYITSLKINP